jgi:hypothetical protein
VPEASKYELAAYADPESATPVFRLHAIPEFSPLDVNVAFLAQTGWNQSIDRLRFHVRRASALAPGDPLARVVTRFEPHLLIRRLDRDEDRFASVHAYVDGDIVVLSNDADFAHMLFQGIFLECPPSFHTFGEVKITEEWLADEQTKALFAGMVAGAQGWDPSHNVPDSIQQSLDEARRALEIADYRVMVAVGQTYHPFRRPAS